MSSSFVVLEALHRQCSDHRQAIEGADRCGCFYCERTFASSEIDVWVDHDRTALCPHCGIDSVVPESPRFSLTAELLQDMHAYWFKRSVELPSSALLQKMRLMAEPVLRRASWLWKRISAA
jgi:hypothetical protein